MKKTLFTLIRDAGRVALYSFFIGPALVLYMFVMLSASEGSLSRQFLTAYHDLTDAVPAGKVMGCVYDNGMTGPLSLPEPGEKLKPAPVSEQTPHNTLCQRGSVDTETWVRSADASLWNFWRMAVMYGFGMWFVLHGLSPAVKNRILSDMHSALVRQNKGKHK
ncbi:hypothetical protein ACQZWC_004261 [Enterobacter bugandensis]